MEAPAQRAALPAQPATLYRSAQLPTAAAQPSAASNSPASVQTVPQQPKQAQVSGNLCGEIDWDHKISLVCQKAARNPLESYIVALFQTTYLLLEDTQVEESMF